MRLADFILRDMESILAEWEAFAATLFPAAASMTPLALRDHAKEILEAVAKDLSTPQTKQAQIDKSRGRAPKLMDARETAAQTHAILRARSGFDINQLASEYRALRASVLRLWTESCQPETLIWKMSFASTRPSTKRSPNRSNFLANKWSGRAICCSGCLAMTCAIRSIRSS